MQIGLALSGGGMRAAVFHLGMLRRLAEDNQLEQISQLSSVSGGSLAVSLVFSHSGMKWPSSSEFLSTTLPRLRELMTGKDLFSARAIGWKGIFRFGKMLFSDRGWVLRDMLKTRWSISGFLEELPDHPVWWINATCIETGKNWRFSKHEMGDWRFGRHYQPPFTLATAAACSAAVPYVIGSLQLMLPSNGWFRTDPATRKPLERTTPLTPKVHLWDGGAYENLGLEPLFKPGSGLQGCDFLICSDASGPLGPPVSAISALFNLFRGRLSGPRLFDVTSDQIRSLRSRMLVDAFFDRKIEGVLLRMGKSVRDIDISTSRSRAPAEYGHYLSDAAATECLEYATDLKAMSKPRFDLLCRHGYEVADAVLTARASSHFPNSRRWSEEG